MNRSVLSIIILLVTFSFVFTILVPKIQSVRDVTIEQRAKVQIAANKKARLQALEQLAGIFSSQSDRVTNLVATLPQDPELPEVLVSVEAMANQSGITLLSLFPQVDAKSEQINLTMVGEGDLGQIEAIMRSIADNSRPMSLSSFSLVKGQGNRLSFNAVVSIPYIVTAKSASQGVAQ